MARFIAIFLVFGAALTSLSAAPKGMVLVPSGIYSPAFRKATDPKEIPVDSFLLDVTPVTNADFLEFVTANPQWRRSQIKRSFADSEYLKLWAGDTELGSSVQPQSPVTFVSWNAARAYARWKEKRLPTTHEWEYAAAASPTRPDGANDPAFAKEIRQWYSSPAPAVLPLVGQRPANFYGVRDLHGLIWEWVADFNLAEVARDAIQDQDRFCGGGAVGAKDRDDFPAFMRFGLRSSLKAGYTVHNLGFRCAQSLESPGPNPNRNPP